MWDRIRLISSGIWSFLRPMITVFLSEVGPILARSAMAAVTATAADMAGRSGSAKRDYASRLIIADLERQGIQVGVSMVNMALETAVQKLKNS